MFLGRISELEIPLGGIIFNGIFHFENTICSVTPGAASVCLASFHGSTVYYQKEGGVGEKGRRESNEKENCAPGKITQG